MVGGCYGDHGRKIRWRHWNKSCENQRPQGRCGSDTVRGTKWVFPVSQMNSEGWAFWEGGREVVGWRKKKHGMLENSVVRKKYLNNWDVCNTTVSRAIRSIYTYICASKWDNTGSQKQKTNDIRKILWINHNKW